MTPIERADRARELLGNETLKKALAELREDLIAKLETCGFAEVETQHEVTLMLQLRKQLISRLERYVQDGAMERKKQEQDGWIEKQRQRLQKWGRPL